MPSTPPAQSDPSDPRVHPDADWQARIDRQWQRLDDESPDAFVAAIDRLAAERPDDPAAVFERACARDSTGFEREAEILYRQALATGRLDAFRQARATLQLASTLRILGRLDESERLLVTQGERAPDGPLADERMALLALTRLAQGRPVEAAALALMTLAPHLTRYRRSVEGNARHLLDRSPAG